MRHQISLLDFQSIENARDIDGLILFGVARVGMRRKAHAAQIGNDDRMISYQEGGERRPHVAGIPETVQQEDRRTLSTNANVEGRAVGGDLARVNTLRERLDTRRGGCPKSQIQDQQQPQE